MLRLWDAAAALHPIDRTLALLRAGATEVPLDVLAALPIGERERCAAALRIATFGLAAEGANDCPACGLTHQIDPPLAEILAAPSVEAEPWTVTLRGFELVVRVLNSRDQAAITHCGSSGEAHLMLLGRCVLSATRDAVAVDAGSLPDDVLAALGEALAERDAFAETLITLRCAGCDHAWTVAFDAGEFLWAEVVMRARRLLCEVDRLARSYHWSEAEVLAMSAQRRQAYLDLVAS